MTAFPAHAAVVPVNGMTPGHRMQAVTRIDGMTIVPLLVTIVTTLTRTLRHRVPHRLYVLPAMMTDTGTMGTRDASHRRRTTRLVQVAAGTKSDPDPTRPAVSIPLTIDRKLRPMSQCVT